MTRPSQLLSIIAHARSGALEKAWQLFREAGYEHATDDPAILTVRGRLLKDRALAAHDSERRRFYLQSAAAYAQAGRIANTTYPLINAATLSLLAGNQQDAQALARDVLERTTKNADEPDTPYYRAATRAEALLLLRRETDARREFASAINIAPLAYEDHASTLRQFALILDEQHADKAWLDAFRPPRSLHFAGRLTLPANEDIAGRVRSTIRNERIGFGYGALSAGADIIVAEALLEAGAELHVILPIAAAAFRDASVLQVDPSWGGRFDAILSAADSVHIVDSLAHSISSPLLQLATEVAMGCCVRQANTLMSEAVQLLVLDRNEESENAAGGTDWSANAWQSTGRRQVVLPLPDRENERVAAPDSGPTFGRLAALLRIDLRAVASERLVRVVLPALAKTLSDGPPPLHPPRWTGDAVLVAFDTPRSAAVSALSIAFALNGTADIRIAGHYAVATLVDDPFGAGSLFVSPATAMIANILESTPLGATHVSEHFAAALCAGPAKGLPRIEYVGELSDEDPNVSARLYSLKA